MDMLCITLRQSKLCVHYHFLFSVILPPSRRGDVAISPNPAAPLFRALQPSPLPSVPTASL